MPVVGDAAVLDLDEVGGDEGNGLALAPRLTERADEVSGKVHVHGDTVAGDNHLLNGHRQVGHGGAELARSEGRPLGSLWTARRQGAVGESRRDSLLQKSVIAGVPEIVERAGSVDRRITIIRRRCHPAAIAYGPLGRTPSGSCCQLYHFAFIKDSIAGRLIDKGGTEFPFITLRRR